MELHLDPGHLIKTSTSLATWMETAFSSAHLTKVAREVSTFTKEAVARAAAIREPIWPLRAGVWGLVLLAVVGAVHQVVTHQFHEILKFLDETKGAAFYIAGFLAVFISLELRLKRRRALQAVNELRALAHIVDMHQLAKDETIANFREDTKPEKIQEYLHACAAMLALLSKIGQLYVEHLPDPVATSAVNDFEMITTGLANKIWMKILSMKRFDLAPVGKPA